MRVRDLDHVIGILGEHGRQPGVGQEPGRVVGRRDEGAVGRGGRQPDRRVEPRADPRALGVHDDALPLAAPEPEEIDVIPRDPALDDQRRLGERLSRLEGAVVFLLGDLRELADREQEGIRDPVVGLNADRVDADGRFRGTTSLSFQLEASPLGSGSSVRYENGAIKRGLPSRFAPTMATSVAMPRCAPVGVISLI